MASDRQKALRHIDKIIRGLTEQQQQLLKRLATTEGINDALEIRHRLDKIQLKLVSAYTVRTHLAAAEAISPPTPELITKVDELLGKMAAFEWQSAKISQFLSTARTVTRGFGRQTTRAKGLA